jgi:hypothetical protein
LAAAAKSVQEGSSMGWRLAAAAAAAVGRVKALLPCSAELLLPSKTTSIGCCPVPIKPPLLGGRAANGNSCWSRIEKLGTLCVQLWIMVAVVSCDAVRAGTQA